MPAPLYRITGPMAIGTRLRRLSDQITKASKTLFVEYSTNLRPRWFSVFYLIAEGRATTISQMAELMQQTHPSISRTLREMNEAKLVFEEKDVLDRRVSHFQLTPYGEEIARHLASQIEDVSAAIAHLRDEAEHDLWKAINEWEHLLEADNLVNRVRTQRKARHQQAITIVDYQPKYATVFRELNLAWIQQYFTVEEIDRASLNNPQGYILEQGGFIFVALLHQEPVGVCALCKLQDHEYPYELAKMAVSPKAQGLGVGYLLGKAVLDKARSLGSKTVYLESNTKLTPALALYRKLGFQKVDAPPSPYARCNIKMAVNL